MPKIIRSIVSRFGLSSVLVIAGRGLYFLFFFLLAKYTDKDTVAVFTVSLATCQLLSSISSFGLAQASQAVVPGLVEKNAFRDLSQFVNVLLVVMFLFVVFVVSVLAFVLLLYPGLGEFTVSVMFGVILLFPVFSLSVSREYLSRSFSKITLAFFPRDVAWMGILCIAVIFGVGGSALSFVSGVSLLAVEMVSVYILLKLIRREYDYHFFPSYDFKKWSIYSKAFLSSSLGGLAFERIDTLYVAWIFGPSATALYSIASRMAPVTSICQRFIVPVLITKFSENLSKNNIQEVRKDLALGCFASLGYAIPVVIVFWLCSESFLSFFGEDYSAGAEVFRLLVCAHLFIAIGSSFGALVLSSDYRAYYGRVIWGAIFIAIFALLLGGNSSITTVANIILLGIGLYNITFIILGCWCIRAGRTL
ncbi:lipopolysaccharide biosynthesis protein [Zhongshania marina]|uniref:Membrane protein involved in the export of O-antigen and teichoic acid n=1 Tax=Zhongshania marina TaxID=2304603 RepID=A0ABX9W6F4_9GAMM|nr:hypothetical protein D0911_03030 [Zhongshania marina]